MSLAKRRLLSLALIGLATFFAFGSGESSDSTSSSETAPASSTTTQNNYHDLGYEGSLSAGGGDILIGREEDDYKEVIDSAIAKDKEGLGKLLMQGRVYSVSDGTRARLIKSSWTGSIRVRILSGPNTGDDGWTSLEFLK